MHGLCFGTSLRIMLTLTSSASSSWWPLCVYVCVHRCVVCTGECVCTGGLLGLYCVQRERLPLLHRQVGNDEVLAVVLAVVVLCGPCCCPCCCVVGFLSHSHTLPH